MNSIFAKMLYELEKNHDMMLVTIISEAGSAPRGTGSQMLMNMDGLLLGTIGGGAVEHQSMILAAQLLAEKRSDVHHYVLRKNKGEDIGMACGGDVSVWFQFVDHTEPGWAELAGAVLEQINARKPGWLVQKLDGSFPTLLGENGEVLAGDAIPGAADYRIPGCKLTAVGFSMPLPIGERAIIFGGGHIARALAPLLHGVGFRVTVMDNRTEFADPADFPGAERVVCGDYLRIADYLDLNEEDYVVVMTNGHSHDFVVQEQALRRKLAYIGVIGSRRKTAVVNARLREANVPEEGIAQVHTPIGTPIKAVTPAEIAISIAGEMICERALRREADGQRHNGCPMH
ncbi:MAG: XdhC family protein [Oscillospiraceae bacterium]|nr:XdhC family protein [Oscillospiraceae bacterium]